MAENELLRSQCRDCPPLTLARTQDYANVPVKASCSEKKWRNLRWHRSRNGLSRHSTLEDPDPTTALEEERLQGHPTATNPHNQKGRHVERRHRRKSGRQERRHRLMEFVFPKKRPRLPKTKIHRKTSDEDDMDYG